MHVVAAILSGSQPTVVALSPRCLAVHLPLIEDYYCYHSHPLWLILKTLLLAIMPSASDDQGADELACLL